MSPYREMPPLPASAPSRRPSFRRPAFLDRLWFQTLVTFSLTGISILPLRVGPFSETGIWPVFLTLAILGLTILYTQTIR